MLPLSRQSLLPYKFFLKVTSMQELHLMMLRINLWTVSHVRVWCNSIVTDLKEANSNSSLSGLVMCFGLLGAE